MSAIEQRLTTYPKRHCRECGVSLLTHSPTCWHCGVDLGEAVSPAATHSALDETLRDRQTRYGSFSDVAFYTDQLKRTLRDGEKWGELSPSQREALDMIASKIGRVLSGNPNHADHWHDIAGYATLVERQIEGSQHAPFDRAALYRADALAKTEGRNLDGSERRECSSVESAK